MSPIYFGTMGANGCNVYGEDRRVIGEIKIDKSGWYYYKPKGSRRRGLLYASAAALKRSLSGPDV